LKNGARLLRFSDANTSSDEIYIFIHGYGNQKKKKVESIIKYLRECNLDKVCYIFRWPSGKAFKSALKGAAVGRIGGPIGMVIGSLSGLIGSYWLNRKRCEILARGLYRRISRLKNAKDSRITLVGHSLGAYLIYRSLVHSTEGWQGLHIKDIILMGPAVTINPRSDEFQDILLKVNGKLYNVWSPDDKVLRVEPSFHSRAGVEKISIRDPNLKNIKMRSWGHEDYWPRFRTVYNATILSN